MKSNGSNIPLKALPALLLLLLCILFTACSDETRDEDSHAYIAGEIVNPTTREVVIKHQGKILDTVLLDERNRFSYRIDSSANGLYLLEHRPETQNIYVTPGDSILLRANTVAFDESLHFSGKGFAKNNFMADMFLQDEANSRLLLSFHKYTPTRFQQIADSIYAQRLQSLETASKKHDFPDNFDSLAAKVIAYENYDLKERYTYLVNKYYKEFSKQFPKDFHNYRKKVNFNSEILQGSPGYRRFIENHLINLSLAWCATSGLDKDDCYNLASVENVKMRLGKVGELIQLPELRQHLLEKIAVRGIVMATSRENIISILETLEEQKVPKETMDDMRQLGTIQLAYLPGTSLQNVPLINMQGEIVELGSVVDQPTVIFLWSVYEKGHEEEHRLINSYRKKYPEVDFIGINMDISEEPAWREAVRSYGYNPEFQYQLRSSRVKKDFFRYYLDKLLFLKENAEVVRGDLYISSPDFESNLLEFLNQ